MNVDAFADTWNASEALPDAVRDAVRDVLIAAWPQDATPTSEGNPS